MTSSAPKTDLKDLDPSRINLGLDCVLQLMEGLGCPHMRFSSVHIAGTNGKGSTAAFISSVLNEAGYKTGLYTSPHLESFNERIKINGMNILNEQVEELTGEVASASKGLPAGDPTYFEFTTAIAFLYFARMNIDIAVIETGLGGRLDASNIITPLVSVITPVALDHAEYLGSEIEGVAVEKGGIIKEGVPVVIGKQEPGITEVLKNIALERGADAFIFERDFDCQREEGGLFNYRGIRNSFDGLESPLYGKHQQENSSTAIAALELLRQHGFSFSEEILRKGIKNSFWPGRFEIISKTPDIILDGAHNQAGAKRLAEALRDRYGEKKGVIIAGFMEDKDAEGILKELSPFASSIILTRPDEERALDPEAIYGRISEKVTGTNVNLSAGIKEALEMGRELAEKSMFILITGSIYLVGEARGILVSDGDDLA